MEQLENTDIGYHFDIKQKALLTAPIILTALGMPVLAASVTALAGIDSVLEQISY